MIVNGMFWKLLLPVLLVRSVHYGVWIFVVALSERNDCQRHVHTKKQQYFVAASEKNIHNLLSGYFMQQKDIINVAQVLFTEFQIDQTTSLRTSHNWIRNLSMNLWEHSMWQLLSTWSRCFRTLTGYSLMHPLQTYQKGRMPIGILSNTLWLGRSVCCQWTHRLISCRQSLSGGEWAHRLKV